MSISAMKNIIYRCTNNTDCLNILYDPTYSVLDLAIFDNVNANFYCYSNLARMYNLASMSDLDLMSYDFILTNDLHTNYKAISEMLHVPIIRYVGFEIGPNFPIENNTYYICEKIKTNIGNNIFSIDNLDLTDYRDNTPKTKDFCMIFNYPEMARGMNDLVNTLKQNISHIDIINTIEYPLQTIQQYKCVLDPFPHNQYNMMYCAINNIAYLCPANSPPAIMNKNMTTMFVCNTAEDIIRNCKTVIEQYTSSNFDSDKKIILSTPSNWKTRISTIFNQVKTKGYIK